MFAQIGISTDAPVRVWLEDRSKASPSKKDSISRDGNQPGRTVVTASSIDHPISRRSALAGLGASGVVLALAGQVAHAAQELSPASHPLAGMWLAMANPSREEDPQFPAPSLFAADGTVVLGFVPASIGMDGNLQFAGSPMGVWAPYDAQIGHFTAVQALADANGNLVGSVTIDGHPKVSDDGETFIDDGSLVTVTIRDATGAIVTVVPPGTAGRPVTATRMRVGVPGFPGDETATPVP
jgi:hypothetical protein